MKTTFYNAIHYKKLDPSQHNRGRDSSENPLFPAGGGTKIVTNSPLNRPED